MFKKIYECDNGACKSQGVSIYSITVAVSKVMVGNGEVKSQITTVAPKSFTLEVCGRDCALKMIDEKLKDCFSNTEKGGKEE